MIDDKLLTVRTLQPMWRADDALADADASPERLVAIADELLAFDLSEILTHESPIAERLHAQVEKKRAAVSRFLSDQNAHLRTL